MTHKVLPEALIEELLAAAEKATPGPWMVRDNCVFTREPGRCVARLDWDIRDERDAANAALIAACDPLTISALAAEVKAARASRVADRTALTDWSMLPRDLYVIDARKHDIGFDVTMCSVPMVTAPEVRYVRADLAIASPPSRVLQDEGVVAVKLLEWIDEGDGLSRAKTPLGFSYFANHRTNMWLGLDDDWAVAEGDPGDAAQADYDARIRSAILPSTIGGSVGVSEVEAAADREWDKLCEKDDRSSPVEYPDMALITRDELRDAIAAALSPAISGEPTQTMRAEVVRDEFGGYITWYCDEADGRGEISDHTVIMLDASTFPIGTKLTITEPASPSIQAQER